MGTRLYPITGDPSVIEALADVPPDTMDRLIAFDASFGHSTEERDRRFNALEDDPDLSRLDHFILFGWGKLKAPVYRKLAILRLDPESGCIRDVELAYHVLVDLQGVVLPPSFPRHHFAKTGGITWF